MPCTYVNASEKLRARVTSSPWPTMMPERIGIIGSTHGVSDSTRPATKNVEQRVQQIAALQGSGELVLLRDHRRTGAVAQRLRAAHRQATRSRRAVGGNSTTASFVIGL